MANNVNTNLASRLFAYIEHNVDITDNIKSIYENSMIFIGDEQQILIPKYNAYVGIGMSSYNSIFTRINDITNDIANFKNDLGSYAVKSINVQWANGSVNQLYNTLHPDDYRKLYGEITLASLDDYNPQTGFAYRGTRYAYEPGPNGGTWHAFGEESNDSFVNASSGISLTYYYDEEDYVTTDGTVLKRPINNRIVIDDKKTWSYMTNAYTYSLSFSRNYTNERIETLYHDILGVGETVYVPITYADMFAHNDATGEDLFVTGDYYYKNNGVWTQLVGEPVSGTQYYTQSISYNNTYNMSLADGIQTLKEVAYILDILSDGTLGTKKYLTQSEWNAKPNHANPSFVDNGITYYRVIAANGEYSTNKNQYGYYIITGADSDNLGIQMAYSIADNNTAIQDLHQHIELNEKGSTSLRSIGHYNIPNSLVSMYQHSEIQNRVNTDVQTSINNPEIEGLTTYTYTLGDTRIYTELNLASTYVSYNNQLSSGNADDLDESVTDVVRFGYFERVDYVKHYHDHSLRNAGAAYYQREIDGTFTRITNPVWPSTIEDAMTKSTYLYWINQDTNRTSYQYANDSFTPVSYTDALSNTNRNYYVQLANEHFELATPTDQTKQYYVMDRQVSGIEEEMFVQRATLDGANHIATTTWTMAYVRDIKQSVGNKVENVLEEAKRYTDSKINALDNNFKYSYSDFYTYWGEHGGTNAVPGTTTYMNAARTAFANWVEWLDSLMLYNTLSNSAPYDDSADYWKSGSYIFNRSRSEYVVNVVQEDGNVTAESRELPTDVVEINQSKWNSQQNGVEYSPITVTIPSTDDDDNVATAFMEALFDYIYDETTHTHKTIYAKNGTDKTKQKATATDLEQNITLYVMNNDGTFSVASAEVQRAVRNNDTTSLYYKQLYKEVDALYEIKLDTIALDSTNVNNVHHYIAHANIITPSGETTIAITTPSTPTQTGGEFTTNLYEATAITEESHKVQYVSGSFEHFKYDQDGGAGQNKLKLDLNITRIEDATFNNTGFADAYDVRDFIENMFSWVNISASVTQSQLESTDGFYKLYPLQSATSEDFEAKIAGRKIYVRKMNGSTPQYVEVLDEEGNTQNGTYTMTYIGKDAQGHYTTGDSAIVGSKHYELTYNGNEVCITYITGQVANINPLNMALTRVR